MRTFPEFISNHLQNRNYRLIQQTPGDVFMRTPDDETVWICYLTEAITPDEIRKAFTFKGYVLFVVDDKIIPQDITDRQSTPMWLRVLHGLYMGRIYTWNGRFLYGLHFDYDNGVINESGAFMPDELLLTEEKTWLRGWTDAYRIARFYDRAWWTGGSAWEHPNDDRRRQKQYDNASNHGGYWSQQGNTYDPPGANKYALPKESSRDFGREFRACNSLDEVKTLWRKLAKEYHPDFNPGKDTTPIMQAINAAYDRAKMVYA